MAAALSLSSFTASPECSINASPSFLLRNIAGSAAAIRIFPVAAKHSSLCRHSGNISLNSCCGMKLWMFGNVNFQRYQGRAWSMSLSGITPLHDGEHIAVSSAAIISNVSSLTDGTQIGRSPAISIAVIGATGELARRKIFPALFSLYYSGQLPQNFAIFGYSRKELMDEDLRAIIATTLTCRIDEQQNCEDKIEAFLKRIHYLNGGFNNREGMLKLHVLMEHVEDRSSSRKEHYRKPHCPKIL
nr:glucose-6-phosphate 1-dehydrogenase 4, chloroplastic isoform X1 [Ipomoea batatas]